MKKSKNLIASMANDLYDQWQICKSARGGEFDREFKRLQAASMANEGICRDAEIQLRQLDMTGFLPDENVLVDSDEVKLINAKRNLLPKNSAKNLLDEFVRK